MSIETMLREEIKNDFDYLKNVPKGSQEYESAVNGLVKLMDRAIDIEKSNKEAKIKEKYQEIDMNLRLEQLRDERIDRWVRNGIAVAGIVIPVGVTIWGTLVTLKFEEEGSVTTIMGRGFTNKLLPKWMK